MRFGGLKGQIAYDDQAFAIDPDIQRMFYGPEDDFRESGRDFILDASL